MNLGDQPAFPLPALEAVGAYEAAPGMTYRQWLIGMIACGNASSDDMGNGEWVIAKADEIITALEKE